MAAQNRHNVANGILSLFVLACGITFSALVGCLTKKLNLSETVDDHYGGDAYGDNYMPPPYRSRHRLYGTCWTFGFAFIITGITGIISALVKAKGAYITHMVFGIIALVVKGAMFIFAIYAFEALSILWVDDDNCKTMGDTCMCRNFQSYNYPCDDVSSMYCMMIGVLSVVVIGWILTLVTTIIAGILGCKKQVHPGVILRAPMTTPVVQLTPEKDPQALYLPETGYLPPIHDKSKLVSNMEFQQGVYGK